MQKEFSTLPAPTGDLVYIVRLGKHIKIGFTSNLTSRLGAFRNSNPDVELLCTIPGNRKLEQQLHELLSEHRITRELFRPDTRLRYFISNVELIGLDRALRFLSETTPGRRREVQVEQRQARDRAGRLNKAQLDGHFATLVADRKRRLGW